MRLGRNSTWAVRHVKIDEGHGITEPGISRIENDYVHTAVDDGGCRGTERLYRRRINNNRGSRVAGAANRESSNRIEIKIDSNDSIGKCDTGGSSSTCERQDRYW